MFCYQCEQTAKSEGCTKVGVCGKQPEIAALQDLLVHSLKGLSTYAHQARAMGKSDAEINRFTLEALFITVTNVNFDPQRIADYIYKADEMEAKAVRLYKEACAETGKTPDLPGKPASCKPAKDLNGLISQGEVVSIARRIDTMGPDLTGLQEMLTYGLKGTAAYADHALILGQEDERIYAFMHEALSYLMRPDPTIGELVTLNLKCGEINLIAMELLDKGNTGTYGHPAPTAVRIEPVKGKAILVSGHDLKDLADLLKQTEGKGINIYTHGEMLPCHGYPELKKYKHLAGNYGGAWQDQAKEFEAFPGPILMTTNCIQKPRDSYKNRIFTAGLVGWPDVRHISDGDFSPVIKAALAAEGFTADGPDKTITVGFGHGTVMGVADKVIDAVKKGAIRHFFLVG
ncbi:MAG: hydroxylamine reductase, partial [Planctomycetes bacterium]|nr:hydroxylamine reductase [Planctomycetota bacterium]